MATEHHQQYNQAFALKHKLRQLVHTILEADDFAVNAADEAIVALSALKDLKSRPSLSLSHRNVDPNPLNPPPHFLCPISGHLMSDPVILASGQTYDRPFIQKWLNEVHKICPQTKQVLSNSILTPNCLVQGMISQWCKEQGVELPKPLVEQEVTDVHRSRLCSLLYKLSLSVSDRKEAAREIHLLTKQMPSIRSLFGNSEVIQKLLSPFSARIAHTALVEPELHEDLITTLLNLSILEDNMKVLAEDEKVMSVLVESLKFGTIQTRSNAAAALSALSSLESNRLIIGKSEAIKYLVILLEVENFLVIHDASSALFRLCIEHENKGTTVREGAVQVILSKMMDHILVDELLALLALLSSHPKGAEALVNHGAVPYLLGLLRETTIERIKENCVRCLYAICFQDRAKRMEMREDETAHGTMSKVVQSQTSTERTKKNANAILEKLNAIPSSSQST